MNASGEPIDMKDERLSSSISKIPHSLFEQLKQKEQFIPADLDGSPVYAASFPSMDPTGILCLSSPGKA